MNVVEGMALRSQLYDRRGMFFSAFPILQNPCLCTYVGACKTAGSVVVKPVTDVRHLATVLPARTSLSDA